jgi:hypothetical protein
MLVHMDNCFHKGESSWLSGLNLGRFAGRFCPLSKGLGKGGKGQGTGIGAGVGVFII